MEVRDKLYIGGAWVASTGTGTLDVSTRSTEEVIGTIPEGTPEDVDRAARCAADAFPEWSATSRDERAKILARVQEGLTARTPEIATLISQEVGMPFTLSNLIQVGLPVMSFAAAAQLATEFPFEEEVGNSLIVREPVGVVGAITPWNYPLHQIAAKVAPALAAGCTVVLKPSEVAPLNAFILAEILDELGLPPGVFNLVTGRRPRRGRGHRLAPPRRHGVVHRLDPGRAARHGAGLGDGQARGPRARREVPQRHPRGRRPRRGRAGRRGRLLPQLRADLLGAHAHARAPLPAGRGRSAGRPDGGDLHARRPLRRRRPASGRSCRPPSSSGCAATSRRASTRGPRSSPAAPSCPRVSTRATSCGPRSSPT